MYHLEVITAEVKFINCLQQTGAIALYCIQIDTQLKLGNISNSAKH